MRARFADLSAQDPFTISVPRDARRAIPPTVNNPKKSSLSKSDYQKMVLFTALSTLGGQDRILKIFALPHAKHKSAHELCSLLG